ncbi:hypothetical protein PMSD_09200 [Paenibacillus macquariensis subsp. defensor]|uniref:DUF2759 domain-containing protein n=1 Tax=Paenibacillus macquariensis TaxID=948756 RepID=A0ABY1K6H1_9BACL|nr:hypothetical protein [Paenibacillus macquariensis]MEC0093602.1 hypothetical protein [Paenibacillus macquariensis]OAB35579.1 hypothetical protein PMSM_10045 [Paenibacillus macquariensis subsp. macquariensis]OAB37721.1 hypothetical protein PMSD_09200 [Paenibacillus macquariensis subsp. defensor]SIR33210.1 hypothetical protein SAMN05421578_11131 [Paenibacillus macquariensis]
MLLAEGAEAVSNFHTFDIFMIIFTILILIGVVRLVTQPVKNLFAIGFSVVSLLVFLYSDYAMVLGWIG